MPTTVAARNIRGKSKSGKFGSDFKLFAASWAPTTPSSRADHGQNV